MFWLLRQNYILLDKDVSSIIPRISRVTIHQSSPPNQTIAQEKIMIDQNVRKLGRMSKQILIIVTLRMFFVVMAILFEEYLIAKRKDSRFVENWNAIYYMLAIMIDCLALINQARVLKFLTNEAKRLEEVKLQLDQGFNDPQTAIGSYRMYLSLFLLIKAYRQRSRHQISIAESIAILQVLFAFYMFGQLAISAQALNDTPLFQVTLLWGFIYSVYWTTFQVDYRAYEGCSGPLMQKEVEGARKFRKNSSQEQGQHVQGNQIQQEMGRQEQNVSKQGNGARNIKQRYITGCRRPFQTAYIFVILLMLGYLIFFFRTQIHCYMLIICISAYIIELVYQKHLQNNLLSKRLPEGYKQLNPYTLLRVCTADNPRMHLFICTLTRSLSLLTIMSFFRIPNIQLYQYLLFILINIFLMFSQQNKFKRMQSCRLYVLKAQRGLQLGEKQQCAICLVEMEKGQRLVQLPCGHVFHGSCLKKWFKQRKQCPLCRASLAIYALQYKKFQMI